LSGNSGCYCLRRLAPLPRLATACRPDPNLISATAREGHPPRALFQGTCNPRRCGLSPPRSPRRSGPTPHAANQRSSTGRGKLNAKPPRSPAGRRSQGPHHARRPADSLSKPAGQQPSCQDDRRAPAHRSAASDPPAQHQRRLGTEEQRPQSRSQPKPQFAGKATSQARLDAPAMVAARNAASATGGRIHRLASPD